MRRIDWVMAGQLCFALIAALSAPDGWGETVFFALLFVGLTCGPEHPFGKRANGEPPTPETEETP